jgi:hypothetical protein
MGLRRAERHEETHARGGERLLHFELICGRRLSRRCRLLTDVDGRRIRRGGRFRGLLGRRLLDRRRLLRGRLVVADGELDRLGVADAVCTCGMLAAPVFVVLDQLDRARCPSLASSPSGSGLRGFMERGLE